MIEGYYYLHTNGDLIYKRALDDTTADMRESDFVRMFWPADHSDRETAWDLLIGALALGTNKDRVADLAHKWECDDRDAQVYAGRVGAILKIDGNSWCATRGDFRDLQQDPAGFGDTALEALAELSKTLGYKAQKMWGASFSDLLKMTQP